MSTFTTSTRSRSNPSGRRTSRSNVPTKSAAEMTMTSDSASCSNHETVRQPRCAGARRRGAPLSLQRVHGRDPCRSPRRRRAEEERGQQRGDRGECQHAPVRRQVEPDRVDRRRQLRHQRAATPRRDEEPEGRARAGQNHALDEQLANEPRPRRAEREPHAQLVLACRGAGQQQVGDIHTRNQQHEEDDREDREQGPRVGLPQASRVAVRPRRARRRGGERERLPKESWLDVRHLLSR